MKNIKLLGFKEVKPEIVEKINERLKTLLDKSARMLGKENIHELKVSLEKLKIKEASRFEVKATLFTSLGSIYTTETGYDILSVMDKIVKELNRLVTKKKERLKLKRRAPANP